MIPGATPSSVAVAIAVLPPDLQELRPVYVNFARRLALIGLEFDQEHDRLCLRLGWRLLAPIQRRHCCFAHVLDAAGTKIDSMDHEFLAGRPPISEWRSGDEARERLFLELPDAATRQLRLGIGVYDPATNIRWPIWASTLPATDEHTAAVVELGKVPPTTLQHEFPDAPIETCCVRFDKGVGLSGYSVSRVGSSVWLRLQWTFRRRPNPHWRFFGHGVADRSPKGPILVSFDQDLTPPWEPPVLSWEQNIVRIISTEKPEPLEIAAGIFHARNGHRLRLLESSLPFDRGSSRVFCPLPPGAAPKPVRPG